MLELLLHLGKCACQVADLVAAAVAVELNRGALGGELKRGHSEPAQAPDDRAR